MYTSGINLGKIFGIQVTADFSVLVIAALLTWSLADGVLPSGAPGLVSLTYWTVAIVIAVLFAASLLAHELAHSVFARRSGIEVEGIRLWMFGGVSQFKSEAQTPGTEFRIAVVGPATNLIFGAVAWGAAYGIDALGSPAVYVVGLSWLGFINVFLGLLNLLPGAPLDGGRLVAAALWRIRHDRVVGQIGAAKLGRVVALGIIGVGAFEMFHGGGLAGLPTLLVGWFLLASARNEQLQLELRRELSHLTVAQVMLPQPNVASPLSTVRQVATDLMIPGRQSAVPILDWEGHILTITTQDDLAPVPMGAWDQVAAIATVVDREAFQVVTPDEPLLGLAERMARSRHSYAVVVDPSDVRLVVGLIGPEQIEAAGRRGLEASADPAATGSPPR